MTSWYDVEHNQHHFLNLQSNRFLNKVAVAVAGIAMLFLAACDVDQQTTDSAPVSNEAPQTEATAMQRETEKAEKSEKVNEIEQEIVQAELRLEQLEEEKKAVITDSKAKPDFAADIAKLRQQLSGFTTYKTDRGTVIILRDLSFSPQSKELSDKGQRALMPLVQLLAKYPLRQIAIEGHADSQGDADENKRLSEARAYVVRDALAAAGIGVRRMPVKGYGSEYPLASNESYAGRERNRRVEIIISSQSGAVPKRQ